MIDEEISLCDGWRAECSVKSNLARGAQVALSLRMLGGDSSVKVTVCEDPEAWSACIVQFRLSPEPRCTIGDWVLEGRRVGDGIRLEVHRESSADGCMVTVNLSREKLDALLDDLLYCCRICEEYRVWMKARMERVYG